MKKRRWMFHLFHRRVFVGLMILLQIAALILLIGAGAKTPWISLGMGILSLFVVVHIVARRSERIAILPWIFLCLLFPVFGGLLYLTFYIGASSRFIRRGVKSVVQKIAPPESGANALLNAASVYPQYVGLMHYLSCSEKFPIYEKNAVTYLPSGEAMHSALLCALRQARRYIFLEYFIIEEGEMWDSVLEVLKKKASEGVHVRVMYDDVGCFFRLPSDYPKQLEREGILCAVFNPFRPLFTSLHNHRDHRKIAVIDGEIAFTGGANLADEYINKRSPLGHWKDAAVRIEGSAALSFAAIFLENFSLCRGKVEDASDYLSVESRETADAAGFVQPYADSPLDEETVGESVYLSVISAARKTLYVTTPYFIVDDGIVKALIRAAKSGVDVRIITPHIGDKRPVHMATRSYYRELLLGGVRVYEYGKGFIHSKTVVSDGCISVIGTTNFDYRSLYHHFECGAVVYGEETADALMQDFSALLAVSCEILSSDQKGGLIRRLVDDLLRIFAPLM